MLRWLITPALVFCAGLVAWLDPHAGIESWHQHREHLRTARERIEILEAEKDAREQRGEALSRALREIGRVDPSFVAGVDEVPAALAQVVRAGDVVITMGAGSIGAVPGRIAQQQQQKG